MNDPPRCCGLGLIHSVAPSQAAGSSGDEVGGVAYIHTPVSLECMQSVTTIVVGMLEAPAALMRAAGMCSPYVAMHCLSSDAGGGGAMRSRRNLARAGQT